MKTTFDAIDTVYSLVTGVGISVHKLTRPSSDNENECIVLNSLPIPDRQLQGVDINVNVRVKNFDSHNPNIERLQELTNSVLALFPWQSDDNNIEIFLRFQSILNDEAQDEHYSNIRLRAIFLNG